MAATYQPLAASGLAAILRIPRIKLRQKETAIMQQGKLLHEVFKIITIPPRLRPKPLFPNPRKSRFLSARLPYFILRPPGNLAPPPFAPKLARHPYRRLSSRRAHEQPAVLEVISQPLNG